ncbi:MAG: hypothetical protein EA382_17730 [Spirochaetaceae bacterium]|nr:MAG: hypothetical protein EA382_17730 [Spirochaetaceae bacterium]
MVVILSAVAPRRVGPRGRIEIGPATVPLVILGMLVVSGVVTGRVLSETLIAGGAWRILVLFFCVAYASTSTDVTGVFDYVAYHLLLVVSGSGRRLFFGVYLLASVLTVFSSNDIVILTLTPIIFHIGVHARIDVKPLLFAQFFGANTLSMLLLVGNPTNIIIATSLGIDFAAYLRAMWFPSLVAFAVTPLLLFLVFRRSLPQRVDLHPQAMFRIRNRLDAAISVGLLALLFAGFVTADRTGMPLWFVALLIAAAFTVEDLAFTVWYEARGRQTAHPRRAGGAGIGRRRRIAPHATFGEPDPPVEPESALRSIPEVTNDLYLAHIRVPWKILPFIIVCFVLVDLLASQGVSAPVGRWLTAGDALTSVTLRTGLVGAVTANLVNNQPMSMFFARAITEAPTAGGTTHVRAAAYAAIIASNLAANLTLLGALAGLMWRRILAAKGLSIGYGEFLWVGIRIVPVVLVLSLLALALVV